MSDLSLAGRRIFVIEDEVLIADNLREQLTEIGAHVIGPTASVDKALELIQANLEIDAAVLDIKLSDQDADRVAEALDTRGVPFVFLTGYHQSALAERFPSAPVCEKPTTMEVIAKALIDVVEKDRTAAGRTT
jgi:two-component SAPR family response regulator